MPVLKYVEEKIEQVERFKVQFFQNGVNVNSQKKNIPTYPFSVAAPGDWTVAEWITKRFNKTYPGYEAQVLDSGGNPVASRNVKLENIRK